MDTTNVESKMDMMKKEQELRTVESKRKVNIYTAVMTGSVALIGTVLAIAASLPFPLVAVPVMLVSAGVAIKNIKEAKKNQEKAMGIQRSIVESITKQEEAEKKQDEARLEIKKENKKNIASVCVVAASVAAPIIFSTLSKYNVGNINKEAGLSLIVSGLSAIVTAAATAEIDNSQDHHKVLKLKKDSWNYTRVKK